MHLLAFGNRTKINWKRTTEHEILWWQFRENACPTQTVIYQYLIFSEFSVSHTVLVIDRIALVCKSRLLKLKTTDVSPMLPARKWDPLDTCSTRSTALYAGVYSKAKRKMWRHPVPLWRFHVRSLYDFCLISVLFVYVFPFYQPCCPKFEVIFGKHICTNASLHIIVEPLESRQQSQ